MDTWREVSLHAVEPARDYDLQTLAEEIRLRYEALGNLYLREARRLGDATRQPIDPNQLARELRRALMVLEPWDAGVKLMRRNPN